MYINCPKPVLGYMHFRLCAEHSISQWEEVNYKCITHQRLRSHVKKEYLYLALLLYFPVSASRQTSFALERLARRNHEVQPIFTTTRMFFATRRSCVANELASACFFDSTKACFILPVVERRHRPVVAVQWRFVHGACARSSISSAPGVGGAK